MEDVVQETAEVWHKYETTHSLHFLLLLDRLCDLASCIDRPKNLQKPTLSAPLNSFVDGCMSSESYCD